MTWVPTRAAGLARLAAFLPQAGRAYARDRNVDRGPHDRANVSALSPWIRRRLITEQEVLEAVVRRHGQQAADKFIQEVFWRTYWKGWLEMRPDVLTQFNAQRLALKAQLDDDATLRARFVAATQGRTGIACFDAWVGELTGLGWLHNHARMWFASIWIFTLRLPWRLGADFMFKHLLDADPASNTLSWRWVAGLHTRGKHYVARAQNIRDNTQGRFDPTGALDEHALPLIDDEPTPRVRALPATAPLHDKRVALLLHEDDLHPESLPLSADVVGVAALTRPALIDANSPAEIFAAGARDDALARAAAHFNTSTETIDAGSVAAWAQRLGVRTVATPYAPTGLTAWALTRIESDLARDGVRLVSIRRPFDERAWPYATAGFFKFKERIPKLLQAMSGA